MSQSHFFAHLSRLKLINRWPLMRNVRTENVSEHSLQVAMVAHALAAIKNRKFGGQVNAERIADQCSNLGVYTISQFDPSVMNSHHEYIHRLHQGNDPVFNREYQEKHEKYFGMLSAIND